MKLSILLPLALQPATSSAASSALRNDQLNIIEPRTIEELMGDTRRLQEFSPVGQGLFGTADSAFGTAVELSSGDSLPLLAVGAPSYDLNVTLQGFTFEIKDAGAVFVYEQQLDDEWNLIWSLPGLDGENMGDRFSLSSSGTRRIALRRYQPSSMVEVYDIAPDDGDSSTTRVGPPIVGSADGNTVAISFDGSRVAVSSESYSSSTGCVQIMEFNSTSEEWEETGSIEGDSNNDLFGWRVAFSTSGSRLAISAPNFDNDGVNRRGLVRVYDYDVASSAWLQVGNDIVGDKADYQLGFSMDLSGNGLSLAVGTPGHDGGTGNKTLRGLVAVYGLFGGNWVQLGQNLTGVDDNDRLGRSVAISADGERVTASSFRHNGDRGHVLVWDWVPSQWELVGDEIEGESSGERVGFGLQGLSMTDNGEMLSYGGINALDEQGIVTGVVRVIEEVAIAPSTAPSVVPSMVPTAAPSLGPSYFPSVAPVVVPWTIEWDGPAEIAFTDESSTEEIKLNYIISNRERSVTVFEDDCETAVPSSVVYAQQDYTQLSVTHGLLNVTLDIIQETIVGSGVWTMISNQVGQIDLCVRVDLLLDSMQPTSVNFHETILSIAVDMSQGFNMSAIEVSPNEPDVIFKNTTVDYNISACQCNLNRSCTDESVGQNSDFFICLSLDADGVAFSDITRLDFIQDSLVFSPIEDGSSNSITTVVFDGSDAIIQTRLISAFFDAGTPVVVEGIAILAFSNSAGGRALQTGALTDPEAGFSVTLNLETSSGAVQERAFFSLAGSMAMVVIAMLLARAF